MVNHSVPLVYTDLCWCCDKRPQMALTIHDQVERTAKALPVAFAGLYVAGFLVVSFRLAGYGASPLDLFRVQYVAAGFWFCLAGAIFFTFALYSPCSCAVDVPKTYQSIWTWMENSGQRIGRNNYRR
jgi:hypothetical protein